MLGWWGASLTRPVLKSAWSYVGWGVYLTRPVLASVFSFDSWEVYCTAGVAVCLAEKWLESFFYTERALICLVVRQERRFS